MVKFLVEHIIPLSLRRKLIEARTWHYYKSQSKTLSHILIRPNTSDIFMFRQVFMRHDYALPFTLSRNTIRHIIDGGANVGYASLWFHQTFPQADIIAIEPESGNFDQLKKNTHRIAKIQPLQKGIWSHRAYLDIVDKDQSECAFAVKEISKRTKTSITAISIPDILKQRNWKYVDILKLDIEGSEYQLLRTKPSWISVCRCIIIELHEEMSPGVTELFHQIFKEPEWTIIYQGENYFLLNNKLKPFHERAI